MKNVDKLKFHYKKLFFEDLDKEYIYVIEVLWPTCHYQGFCQFIMDKTQ